MNNLDPKSFVLAISAIAAAIAVFTGIGAGIMTGHATGKAVEAVSRQPEAKGEIVNTLVIGCAFSEATAVYGLLVAIILLIIKIV